MKSVKITHPVRIGKRKTIAETKKKKAVGQGVEALEGRIAPATLASLSSGSISVLGDQGGVGEVETLHFTVSAGDLHITDPTHGITAGAGFSTVSANEVSIPLSSLTGDFTINTGTGADLLSLDSALNLPGHGSLTSGGDITFNNSLTLAAGKNLTAVAGGAITLSSGTSSITTSGSGTQSFMATTLTVGGAITSGGSVTTNAATVTLTADIVATTLTGTATVVYVDDPGSIQDGVNVAATGATVNVAAGTYNELVEIGHSVTLLGAQHGVDARTGRVAAAESIIDGSGKAGVIHATASHVIIDGFVLQGDAAVSATAGGYNAAISVYQAPPNATGFQAVNNIIQHVPIGIAPTGDTALIQHNLIRNLDIAGPASGTGIYTDVDFSGSVIDANKFVNITNTAINLVNVGVSTTNNIVSNNEMDSQIYLYGQTGAQVTGNKITNSSSGGIVLGGNQSGLLITGNEVNGVAAGFGALRLRDDGGGANSSLTVTGNKFVGGAGAYGVRPGAGSYSGTLTLSGNQISGGTAAIQNDDAGLAIDASGNYFGSSVPATVSATILGAGAANVDFTPLLDHDESVPNQAVTGFTADYSSLTVHALGAQTGATGRIQEGFNLVTGGGTVHVASGTYASPTTIGAIDFGSANVTLVGDAIDFVGGAGSVTGTGTLTIVPATADASIAINGGAGTLQIDHTDLLALGSGFANIVFGTAGQAHDITFDTDSGYTFSEPVVFNADGAGGSVAIYDSNLGNGRTAFHSAGLTIHGSGATTTLLTDVVTAGAPILINDSVIVAADVTLDSTNAGGSPAGANVTITGFIESDSADHFSLTIAAGTAGDVVFGDGAGSGDANIGATEKLGALVVAAHAITFSSDVASVSTLGGSHTGNVSLTSQTGLALPAMTLGGGGALSVSAASGNITQTGALVVTGATSLSAGSGGDILLDTFANNFVTVSVGAGHDVQLLDQNAIDLGASTISGHLYVSTDPTGLSGAGAVTQSGALHVTGTTIVTAGLFGVSVYDVTLNNSGNLLSSAGVIGHQVSLYSGSPALDLIGINATGNLTLLGNGGSVTQSGMLAVGGTLTVDSVGAPVALNTFTNSVTAVAVTHAFDFSLLVSGGLSFGVSQIGHNLQATTHGAITQTGSILVAGTTTLSADAANNITLTNAANDFSTVGITTGNNVLLTDASALILGTSTVSGTLGVTTNGPIVQSGAVTVAGVATFAAGSGNNITLNSANNFSTFAVTSGNNVSVTNSTALTLGASTVSGTLSVTTSGPIAQSGALVVTGVATFAAGSGNDITLNNASNNFSSVTITTGNNVQLTDVNALTVNASTVSGTFGVTAVGITVAGALSLGGDTTFSSAAGITFNNAVTMAVNKNFTATATGTGTGTVNLANSNADLAASGTGAISITTVRDITLSSGASIITANGALSLSANAAGTNTTMLDGILVNAATVQVTGSGNLTLVGKGGTGGAGANPDGIVVFNGGVVQGGTSGTVSVTGTGGSGTSDNTGTASLIAVKIMDAGSTITSSGANVQVTGIGGTSAGGMVAGGVLVFNGATISAGGTGTVTVTGTGGASTDFNFGVDVVSAGSQITSNNGAVTVTGTGGTGGSSNWGVFAQLGGKITAGGATSAVNVTGTGGSGSGGLNHGVVVRINVGGPGLITSSGGNVTVTGTAGSGGAGNFGISTQAGGSVSTATSGGNITLIADSMDLTGTIATQAAGTVTVRQLTNGTAINLGAADGAGVLGLTDAELDTITAGTVQIGDNNSGAITVSAAMTHTNTNAIILTAGTGQNINLNANFTTAGGAVTFSNATVLGASATVDTTNAGGTAAGAAVSFGSTVNADAAVNTRNLTITAGTAGAVTLGGAVGGTARPDNLAITGLSVNALPAISLDGTLGITTTSGGISQSGVLTVVGATTLAVTSANNITLNLANDFSTLAVTSGNNVSVTDTNALVLGTSTVSGTLGVTTSGAITQSGALTVTGVATFAAGAGNNITLNTATNNFSTLAVTSGNNVSVTDTNALILGASTVSGTLGVNTSGAITQSGALVVTGTTTLAAGAANNITLNTATNNFSTLAVTSGNNVSVTDTNALDLGASTVSGTLGVNTSGAITQSGALTVTGVATFAAGAANNITLNAANDFSTFAVTSGNNVSVTDANALILGASTVSGTLGVNTSGALTQSGVLVVTGVTTLAVTSVNNITLNLANNFSTLAVTSGNNVSVTDTNALILGASTVSGTLGVNTGGALTQSGALVVTGVTTLAAGAGNNITLNTAANDFSTLTVTSGNNVSVTDTNALILGASTVSGTLGVNTSGAITQSGTLTVTGVATFAAGAGNSITLNTATNDFSTFAVTTGLNVSVTDANALILGASTVSGTLGVNTSGAITQSGALVVTGVTTLAAGAGNNITLNNAANNFSTLAVTTGNNVSVTDTNALILGASTVSGTLGVNTSGAITQSGALVVTGAATFAAGAANSITLNTATNNFSTFAVTNGNNVSVTDTNAIILGASTVSGNLAVTTTGTITQSGALAVTGTSAFSAGANSITLTTATNDFTGAVSFTNTGATNAVTDSITDVNGIVLGTSAVASSNVVVNAVGITQTGLFAQSGTIANAGTITLTSTGASAINLPLGNSFIGQITASTTNGAITLVNGPTSLMLTSVTAGGGGTITGTSTGSSSAIRVASVTTTGNVTLTSGAGITELPSDAAGLDISCNVLTITTVNSIGSAIDPIEIDANSVSVTTTTGSGASINLTDLAGGVTFTNATTTTSGAINLEAVGGNLIVTSAIANGTSAISLKTTTSGDVIVDNVSAAGSTITINSAGSILEAGGGDAGADLTAATLSLTAVSGIGTTGAIETAAGSLSGTTATGGVALANTGVLTVTGLTVTTSGNINLSNVGALTTSGVVSTAGGTITLTAASPVTVGANMTATGDIILTAGEISDSPTFADDFTLNGGATIQSTAGNITLRAGDDVAIAAGTTVNAFGTVTLQAGFGDLDGGGSLSVLGTIISGGALSLSSAGDIVVGFLNAPGQTVTLTADSDNNGTGGIYGDGVAATNIIASTLIASASTRIAATPDAGAYGLHLVTQISNLTATVANGAGDISISNTGALAVTSASTSSGNVIVANTGGSLTVASATAGGAGDITLTTTGAGNNVLVGSLTAAGDDITINSAAAITDNNGATTNFTGLNLSLTAVSGIGAADALESIVSNLVATNTTGNIQVSNTGALTINGANVTGASGNITINAASPLTIAANESAPGAISHTAGETSDSPTFADDLTINPGVSVTSTGSSVTLLAGDDIITGAGSLVSAATTLTVTAASGDLDGEGGLQHSGTFTAAGTVTISARDTIALGGDVTSTGGNVSITSTTAAITHSAGTVSGGTVGLSAPTGIGAGGADVLTAATTLSFATTTGNVFITESNGATVSGTSTSGNINLTSTTGDWTLGGNVSTTGNVSITASAGDIVRTAGSVSGNVLTFTAGGADGDIGTAGTPIQTSGTTINFAGAGTGEVAITESNGATVSGTTGSGAINLISTTGDWTIGGNVTTTGNATLTASAGDIARTAGTVSGNVLTFTAGGADGDIGAVGAPIQTAGTTISFTGTGTGEVAITESNGATVSGTTGSGDINLVSTTGDWTLGGNVATTGNVNVSASAGDIVRTAGTVSGNALTFSAGGADGDIGASGAAIRTDGTSITFTGAGTGDVYITESNGALVSGSTGSGVVTLISTSGDWTVQSTGIFTTGNVSLTASAGDLLRSGPAAVVAGNGVTLTAGGADGGIGTLALPFLTNATTLGFTATGTGDVYLSENSDVDLSGSTGAGNAVVSVTAGGDINLGLLSLSAASSVAEIVAAGAVFDNNLGLNNITALAAIITGGTGVGTSANPLDTNLANLEADGGIGGVFINEANALTIGGVSAMDGVSAGTGDIEITTGGSLSIAELIQTPDNVVLTAGGTVTEGGTGAVDTVFLTTVSVGGQTLDGPNTVDSFTATNTGALSGVVLDNTANDFDILAVTSQTGGAIVITNFGTNANVDGVIKSGTPANGGNITVSTDGLLTVNSTVDSSGGTGGTLTLGGLLTLNASPIVGLGNVTLQGGTGPLTINAPISVSSPLVLQSTEDINILAKVQTTSLLSDITVLADSDGDGSGGVYIGDNIFIGSLKAGRNLDVRGSEYMGSYAGALAGLDNGVIIETAGTSPRLEATGDVFVKINNAAPVTSQIWLGGLVRSNGSGNVHFDSAILVTSDDARVVTHGGGDIIFNSTIDSDASGPFNLRAATDVGVVLFSGAVGSVEPLGDVTVEIAFDVVIAAPFTAGSFTVDNALGTVSVGGDLTTTNDGLNLNINAVNLITTAPIDMTASGGNGDGLLNVNNIDLGDTVAGNGVLTIQPRDTARTIGINEVGDLNLDDTEIGQFQNGFQQIIIGRTDGNGLITVGSRIAPDYWLDPVVFRSPGTGGQISLTGQLYATDDGGFTFLAPSTLVNVPTLPSISVGSGEVNFGSLTAGTAVSLLSDLDIETVGGDVLFVGTINGHFALSVDAGLGAVNLNGNLTPTPSGTSIGGTVALESISISGGALQIRPNVQTSGDQTYTGTSIQVFSGAYTALTTGSILFDGDVVLSNSVGVFTHGGDITFDGTVNNVADPLSVAGKGALQLNAGTGAITFTGIVGGTQGLKTVDINATSALTIADDFSVAGYLKVKADEIDFNGGINSVNVGGAVEFHPSATNVSIEIGGAETATPNSLSLSEDDIAALTDGATSILISELSVGLPISVVGPVTFHDPTTISTNAKTGGDVTVIAELTGDTVNGSLTLKGPHVNLGADITTTGGGFIDISNGVLQGTTVLDTSTGDGDVTLRDKFLGGGEDLTISAGAGNINILTRLGLVNSVLGDVSLSSSGSTVIKLGGYMQSLFIDGTDGGGTTFLGGRIQTNSPAGQDYGDAVILTSGVTLVSTSSTGVIHFGDTVDSTSGKHLNLGITNRAAIAGTEVVTFDPASDIGTSLPADASRLGNLIIQTRGDVTVGGVVNAISLSLKAGAFTLDDVTVQKNLLLAGDGTFSGALSADKLSIRSASDIDNGGVAWTATTSAAFYSLNGSITTTGANVFGTLLLTGDDATVEEVGNMSLGAVRLRGTLDVTTTAGGNLTQLASQRVVAGVLEGDIAGSISLAQVRNTFGQIGDATVGLSAGGPIEIWSSMPRATILDGVISTASGDITLVADPLGHLGFFQLGANISLQPAGRWVVYSNYDEVPSMNIDLVNDLGPDHIFDMTAHPFAGVPATGDTLIYVRQIGR